MLRYSSPVLYDPRRASRNAIVEGGEIREGELVLAWIAAANRDEKVFEDPQRFDIGRGSTPHLAFGLGIHHCLGASLARLGMKIALDTLVSRTRSFEPRRSELAPMHPSPVFGAVTRLPVHLEPA